MPDKRTRATSTFIRDGNGRGYRARVPAEVRDRLKARVGDVLIFEEGSESTVNQAMTRRALKKETFFIVRIKRSEAETGPTQVEVRPHVSPPLESLAETVRRKQVGKTS